MDPYGIWEARGRDIEPYVGKHRFVRSPESRGWVWERDLPPEKFKAMYDRIGRDRDAYDVIKKKFVEAAATFRLPDDIGSFWDAWHVIQGAVREFAAGRGVLDVRTVAILALDAMEAGIKSRRSGASHEHRHRPIARGN
jgi:hypothetical protein